jgi:8-oxo-dGTP pyrophosphatase MutT (NUDIX family)
LNDDAPAPRQYTADIVLREDRTDPTEPVGAGEHKWADSVVFCDPRDPIQLQRWLTYTAAAPISCDKETGLPVNPCGGSNIVGRGNLGLWGPNPAADNLLFRWADDPTSEGRTLQLLVVQRRSGAWALPGGMKAAEDLFCDTATREAQEELDLPEAFAWGQNEHVPYAGVVAHDPRNTQNAWMVTAAFMLHPDDPRARTLLHDFEPRSTLARNLGNETLDAQWLDIDFTTDTATGVAKDGTPVRIDLCGVQVADPYGDNVHKAWVKGLPKPREGMQALFASHGEIVLSAKKHLDV